MDETCQAVDTRPVNRLVKAVFEGSRALVLGSVEIARERLRRGRGDDRVAPLPPEAGSSPVSELLDRLTLALWGDRSHLARLDRELAERLPPPVAVSAPLP